jgi:hypothetical protein
MRRGRPRPATPQIATAVRNIPANTFGIIFHRTVFCVPSTGGKDSATVRMDSQFQNRK